MNLLNQIQEISLRNGESVDHYVLTIVYEVGDLEINVFADVTVKENNTWHSDVNDFEYDYDVNVKNMQVEPQAKFTGYSGSCTLLLTKDMQKQVAEIATAKIETCEIDTLLTLI